MASTGDWASTAAAGTVAGSEFELTGGVPAEVLAQAQRQARAVGYAQGWAQGLREAAAGQAVLAEQAELARAIATEAQAAQVASAVQAVLTAADQVRQTVVEVTDELSDRMLAAAIELAAVLLGQQLTDPETAASAALRRVLEQVPDDQPVSIRLSRQDYETLTGPGGIELAAAVQANAPGRISLECDPSLAPGDALGRAAATSIDARLTAALARLREYAR
ncbi:MAG TPA: FliH/SctL family protein [Jatrophihabitans sp.]|nr:FliH/SctL family protein [Jatrophihabitans sp.]